MSAQHTPAGRLRWKKEPKEAGLRSIGRDSSKRSSLLHDGKVRYAVVSSLGYHALSRGGGWYWVAGWESSVPHKNTCDKPVATEAEAKAAALAYVRAALAQKGGAA